MKNIDSKKLSCGIVFVNKKSEILMLHPAGQSHWDIPKGTKNTEEREAEAAIRETQEETGIVIAEDKLKDLSWFEYNKFKDLWIFIAVMPDIDIKDLYCSSYFIDDYGQRVPEADMFEMVSLDEMENRACFSLKRMINSGGLKKDIKNFIKARF